MFADYHVHTEFSDDSRYKMEDVVKDALKLGMSEICFTDHVDYGVKPDWDSGENLSYRDGKLLVNVDYPLYEKTIKELQYRYGDRIAIKMGMEFGMQVSTIPQYEKLFREYLFDFIILSVHEVGNREFWNQDFQTGHTQEEYNERYYEEILKIIRQYKSYSVLGHLDLITRYDENGIYPFEKVRPVITEILKQVILDGRGIEVNTSSHRYGLKNLTPSREILTLYRELGGTILSLGSDSHAKEDLGSYILETKKELLELGFTDYYTYEKMHPVMHSLKDDK